MAKSSAKNSTNSGKFQPGQSGNPAGRPVGSRNRFSQLKEAFVEAFEGIGGVDSLMEWARDNKDKFYPLNVFSFQLNLLNTRKLIQIGGESVNIVDDSGLFFDDHEPQGETYYPVWSPKAGKKIWEQFS